MKGILLLLVIFMTSCDYYTTQKVVTVDKVTKLPIAHAKVNIGSWKLETDSIGLCYFEGVTGDLTKRTIEAKKEGYADFQLTLEFDDGYLTYQQKLDSTYTPVTSFAAMNDTLVIYLSQK